ncbi:MAG: hypothetical protein LUC48_08850 [Clostridiales bacterium]|nr:hypothetical protein [Clostridiales bacterium]
MAYYNEQYSYPDLFLWRDETWEGCENAAAPLFRKLEQLIAAEQQAAPGVDHYADRHDEATDKVNRAAYFPDVVAAWQEKGMYFSSYGMMGEQMAPTAVERHQLYNPRVLLVPYVETNRDDPHNAMNRLANNAALLETAARENILVQFAECKESTGGALIEKGIETQGTFRISYDPLYVDISALVRHGLTLADVPGLDLTAWPEPETLAGRTVVNISDKWQVNLAHQYTIGGIYRRNQPEWDYERHIRSMAGKRQAEGMRLERDYTDPHDPKMAAFWQEKGIRYEDHYIGHDWYVTLTPESAYTHPDHKLPVLLTLKEPRTACPCTMQTAFQFYYDFIELCGRGEFMMVYFALETPEDNDEVLPSVLEEVLAAYPTDPSRVYITGQSHNGYYALEFYRRHPKLIAAAATLCDPVGLQVGARIDYYMSKAPEIIASFRQYDYPLIDINGQLENSYQKTDRTPEKIDEDVAYFQNRLKAFKLPMRSREEILAAQDSPDYVTRRNGVPADRTEVRYVMGSEAYLSDYRNENGKWYFRYISLENTPHMIMPQMAELSWEFLRRFARNTETGEVIERY